MPLSIGAAVIGAATIGAATIGAAATGATAIGFGAAALPLDPMNTIPATINAASGRSLATTSRLLKPLPIVTPIRFAMTGSATTTTIAAARPVPAAADGKKTARYVANSVACAPAAAIGASTVNHATWMPSNRPNAVRTYR